MVLPLRSSTCHLVCRSRRGQTLPQAVSPYAHRGTVLSRPGCRAAVPKKRLMVQAGKRAAAAAAAAAVAPQAAAPLLLPPELAFSTATYLMVPTYIILAFFPRSKLTTAILDSPLVPLAFGLAYAVLAWQAWQAGSLEVVKQVVAAAQPLPDAASLAGLFQHKALAALAWLHLLMLDFLTARAVVMDGLRHLVPTCHSVWLCFMVGPLGLLSHLVTRVAVHKLRKDKPAVASSSMWGDY